ncbi:MAG: RidA family protein, partial [Actinomycetota bacterium]
MSKPVGPYTPIVEAGPWLICSGQVGIADGALVEGGMEAELRQAMANMAGLLEGAGASMNDVVKTTVFITEQLDVYPIHVGVVGHVGEEH